GVDQSTARITLIDGSVRLEEVFEVSVAESRRAALSANDAGRNRLADAEGIADSETKITHSDLIRISKGKNRQARTADFQQRDVAWRVGANQLRSIGLAVVHFHGDLLSAINDVVIGQDLSVLADDHSRAQSPLHRGAAPARRLLLWVTEKPAEEGIVSKWK